jgi:hypothetical protein
MMVRMPNGAWILLAAGSGTGGEIVLDEVERIAI